MEGSIDSEHKAEIAACHARQAPPHARISWLFRGFGGSTEATGFFEEGARAWRDQQLKRQLANQNQTQKRRLL
jgi:hypothetical protein